MKRSENIIYTVILLLFFGSCGQKHSNNDGHDHADTNVHAGHGEEQHSGETVTITSLTQEQMASVGIVLGEMEMKNLTAVVKANGVLRVPNNNKANITPLYGGVIRSMAVQLGDRVKKGQVIATVANPQFIQLQEEYLMVSSQIVLADQELQRQQELNEGKAGTRKNLQSANAQINALRTKKASLQQQIRLMGIDPETVSDTNLRSNLVVTSPINGVVSNVFAKIGSYVDVSSPVMEVVDNDLLHLDLQVFEKDLSNIRIGQIVNFTITNNPSIIYSAKVFSIGASFENESKSIAVHCNVVGNKSGLIDGMNTVGTVSLDQSLVPAVPTSAIVEADGKNYIFVRTDKEGDEHEHEHEHEKEEEHQHVHEKSGTINFEKIEVIKGVSEMGYTAITLVSSIPSGSKIAVKNGFFINAKMSNTGGHAH
ncbi:efflux RND transporter periplasmic adaptor subunit [Sphingobacterium sp. LRF_L2]|uniref:efflux RND transporter periplasmic adaptor subunit n=1 Tax=Sphingobacterium sp. LRF_L2 TaxID=3369421 RepID=UPI003F6013D2